MLNGKTSRDVDVSSGVPQGSVIGPLLFLIYINDICSGISSQIRLSADDCVLYRTIHTTHNCNVLQNDLYKVNEWCKKWHMLINLKRKKNVHMRFSRKRPTHDFCYSLNATKLLSVQEHKHLGVYFTPEPSH